MSGPLDRDCKVVELAQIMAGPTCGMLLADMGADVIKVEKMPGGDDTRAYKEPRVNGESAAFLIAMNRNKRSIASTSSARRAETVLRRLLAPRRRADRELPAPARSRSSGSATTRSREINPALIYCAVSGYGRTGPYADKGGFDLIAQGFSGLMSITGEPGGAPVKTGNSVADINAGILAALGIVSAYVAQAAHRRGPVRRDLPDGSGHAADLLAGRDLLRHRQVAGATGSAHVLTAPYQAFRDQGRLGQHRRRQPGQLGAHRRGARARPSGATTRASAPTPTAWPTCRRWSPRWKPCSRHARPAEWVAAFDKAGVPVGPVQLDRRRARPSAGARPRHGARDQQHPRAGTGPGARLADQVLGNAGRQRRGGADARRAHARDPRSRLRDAEIDAWSAPARSACRRPRPSTRHEAGCSPPPADGQPGRRVRLGRAHRTRGGRSLADRRGHGQDRGQWWCQRLHERLLRAVPDAAARPISRP